MSFSDFGWGFKSKPARSAVSVKESVYRKGDKLVAPYNYTNPTSGG